MGRQPPDVLVPFVPSLRRIGHKGADHIAPGNTPESFDAALAHGVHMIEFDVLPEDLEALDGVVAGINVKLAKCGGIGPAYRMLDQGREMGFRTFLGCMEETSIGIAASAVVASLEEWVDLDGNLLLADDPFEGLRLAPDKRWQLPDRPGLGLTRKRA